MEAAAVRCTTENILMVILIPFNRRGISEADRMQLLGRLTIMADNNEHVELLDIQGELYVAQFRETALHDEHRLKHSYFEGMLQRLATTLGILPSDPSRGLLRPVEFLKLILFWKDSIK